jgi:hypothetical protein
VREKADHHIENRSLKPGYFDAYTPYDRSAAHSRNTTTVSTGRTHSVLHSGLFLRASLNIRYCRYIANPAMRKTGMSVSTVIMAERN